MLPLLLLSLLTVPYNADGHLNGPSQDQLEGLYRRVDGLSSDLQHLSDRNLQLEQELKLVKIQLRAEETRSKHLQEAVDNLRGHDQALKESLTEVTGAVSMLNRTCDHHHKNKRQLTDTTVAFTAVVSKTDLTHLTPRQTIVFDKVITNINNSYDSSTGIFTAPVFGVYGFNMDVMVEPGQNEYLEFVKDGYNVMYNYAHASGSLHDASSSRMVVVELEAGNQVWIQTTNNPHHGSGTIHGNEFTTFSGFLIAFHE